MLKRILVFKISTTSIIQLCVVLLVFYNFWIIRIIGDFFLVHWGLLLIAIILAFCNKGFRGILNIDFVFLRLFLLFTIVSTISGFFVVKNYSYFFKAVVDNFEYAIIMNMILWISVDLRSTKWIISSLLCILFICAITAVLQGIHFNGRLILGNSGNSNDLGIKMVYAILCVLLSSLRQDKRRFFIIALRVIVILLFLYVIILTSSRKSFFIAAFLLTLYLFLVLPKSFSGKKKMAIFIFLPIFIFGLYKGALTFLPSFQGTKLFQRLLNLSEGLGGRLELMAEAFEIFKYHPLFGVGLNNFRVYSKTGLYSHSTIAETLSCTGIVGTVIFLLFSISFIKKFYSIIRKSRERNPLLWMNISGYVALMILSLGVILYYDYASMLMLTIIACYTIIESRNPCRSGLNNEHY